jgi:hypothetical protein
LVPRRTIDELRRLLSPFHVYGLAARGYAYPQAPVSSGTQEVRRAIEAPMLAGGVWQCSKCRGVFFGSYQQHCACGGVGTWSGSVEPEAHRQALDALDASLSPPKPEPAPEAAAPPAAPELPLTTGSVWRVAWKGHIYTVRAGHSWRCHNPTCGALSPHEPCCLCSGTAGHWEQHLFRHQARPTVVTLCGSTRFYAAFQEANYRETMAGRIVLSVGFYPHATQEAHGEALACTPEEKRDLDELHKRKIDMSDEILVLNVGGYVGESTESEILYTLSRRRGVRWWEPEQIPARLARLVQLPEQPVT